MLTQRTIRMITRPEVLPLLVFSFYGVLICGLIATGCCSWALLMAASVPTATLMRRCASGGSLGKLVKSTSLKGKVAIVTGANSGIGFYTALLLGEMGATVVITCRTVDQTILTATQLRAIARRRGVVSDATNPSQFDIRSGFTIELDNFASIKKFAAQFSLSELPLHFLVNNAGMMVTGLQFSHFEPDLEKITAVNVLGPLLLTELMIPHLSKTSKEQKRTTRIVHVSSELHDTVGKDSSLKIGSGELMQRFRDVNRGKEHASGYLANTSISASFKRYGYSKLANVFTSHYCANRYPTESSGVWSCSLHPGRVITGFMNNLICTLPEGLKDVLLKCFLKTSLEGAYTTVYACICSDTKMGRYIIKGTDKKDGSCACTVVDVEKEFDTVTAKQLATPCDWKYISPFLADCRDRTLTDLDAVGYSLCDAKEVVDWCLLEIRKRLGSDHKPQYLDTQI